jgi:hypothetical protein
MPHAIPEQAMLFNIVYNYYYAHSNKEEDNRLSQLTACTRYKNVTNGGMIPPLAIRC